MFTQGLCNSFLNSLHTRVQVSSVALKQPSSCLLARSFEMQLKGHINSK